MAKKKPATPEDFSDLTNAIQIAIARGFQSAFKNAKRHSGDLSKSLSSLSLSSFNDSADESIAKLEALADAQDDLNRLQEDMTGNLGKALTKEDLQKEGMIDKLRNLGLEKTILDDLEGKMKRKVDLDEKDAAAVNDLIDKATQTARVEAERLAIAKKHNEVLEESKRKVKEHFTLLKSIAKDPALAKSIFAVEGAKAVKKEFDKFVGGFNELRKSGLSMEQSSQGMMKAMSPADFMGLADSAGVVKGMAAEFGSVNVLTKQQTNEIGHMAHKFGIAGDEAFKLHSAISRMPGETKETATHTLKTVGNLAKAKGVAPGQIMSDMAKNTEAMARYSKGGAEGFAKAAISMKQMGLELSTAVKMADSLLDFENSINKQVEASVLLGREVNFDRARELALAGDLEGVTKEMIKNLGSEAEWNNMNVAQKDALAAAAGVTSAEIQKQLDATKKQNEYFGEQATWQDNIRGHIAEYGPKVAGLVKDYGMLALTGGKMVIDGAKQIWQLGRRLFLGGSIMAQDKIASTQRIAQINAEAAAKRLANPTEGLAGGVPGGRPGAPTPGVPAAPPASNMAGQASQQASQTGQGMNPTAMIKAAIAIVIIAAALWVFAKALQELEKVKDIKKIAITLIMFAVLMIIFGVLMKQAGKQIMSPYVALAILALAVVILTLGVYMKMATPLVQAIALVIQQLGRIIIAVLGAIPPIIKAVVDNFVRFFAAVKSDIGVLMLLGPALMMIGAGLVAMAYGGILAMPAIGALIALATVAPALVGLGNAIGGIFGGGKSKKDDKMDKLITKIDSFTDAILKQQVVLKMDGQKVAESVRLNTNASGVR